MPEETIDVASPESTDLAVPDEFQDVGLEDFDDDDLQMSRLNIVHEEAEFEDNLTGERYEELDGILLGLVKQRVLWAPEMGQSDHPWCKSVDAEIGRPDKGDFPWKQSGFSLAEHADEDHPELSCGDCRLKEWDSHPNRKTPWCSEQYVMPLAMPSGDKVVVSLITLQRSAIPPAKSYISGFKNRTEPLFVVHTKITLKAQQRGNVHYSVPKLVRGEAVDRTRWPDLASAYRSAAAFLRTPRVFDDASDDEAKTSTPESSESSPESPAPAPETDTSGQDDDELF